MYVELSGIFGDILRYLIKKIANLFARCLYR